MRLDLLRNYACPVPISIPGPEACLLNSLPLLGPTKVFKVQSMRFQEILLGSAFQKYKSTYPTLGRATARTSAVQDWTLHPYVPLRRVPVVQ